MQPTSLELYKDRAAAFTEMGKFPEAIASYSEAIRLRDHPFLHYTKAGVYKKQKRYREAIEEYSSAILLSGSDPFYLTARARAWKETKDYDRAIDDFIAVLTADPKDTSALGWLTRIKTDHKETATRIDAFLDQSLASAPDRFEALLKRGDAFVAEDWFEEAHRDYESAAALKPKDPAAYLRPAQAWRQEGKTYEATMVYATLLDLDPNAAEPQPKRIGKNGVLPSNGVV